MTARAVARESGRRAALGRLQVLARAARASLRAAPGGRPGGGGDRARRGPHARRRPRRAQRLLHRLPGQRARHGRVLVEVRRGGAAGPALGGQRRHPAGAARGQPARPAVLRPLPAHLRGAAGGARRADPGRRGPRHRARPRALAGRGVARALPRAGDEPGAALGGRSRAAGRAGGVARRRRAAGHDRRSARAARWSTPCGCGTGRRWSSTRRSTCCAWRARSPTATSRSRPRRASVRCGAPSGARCWPRWTRSRPASSPTSTRFAEPFKRLGERLHPHEYPRFATAQDVFAVARGERDGALAGRAGRARAGRRRRRRGGRPCWPTRPGCSCAAWTGWPARAPATRSGRALREAVPGGLDARAAVAAPAPAQPRGAGLRAPVRQPAEPRVGHGRRARAAVRGHRRGARRGARHRAGGPAAAASRGSSSNPRCGRSPSR